MNIRKYMQAHEAFARDRLDATLGQEDWLALKGRHAQMIRFMQHERLIHLIVTLAFAAFLLFAMALAFLAPVMPVFLLMGLIFLLLIPYVSHYFFLENTVQRWYRLADEIEKKSLSMR